MTNAGMVAAPNPGWRTRFNNPDSPLRFAILLAGVLAGLSILWLLFKPTETGSPQTLPIITAEQKPSKHPPEDPGGLQVAHQDKLVYERLETGEEAILKDVEKVEHLMPIPEIMVDTPTMLTITSETENTEPSQQTNGEDAADRALATLNTLSNEKAAPLSVPTKDISSQKTVTEIAQSTSTASPSSLETTHKTAAPTSSKKESEPAVKKNFAVAPKASKGRYPLQLASLKSPQQAEQEWRRLRKLYPDLLKNISYKVVRVDLGRKGIYHRVYAGPFTNKNEAEQLYNELRARKAAAVFSW